MLPLPVTVIAPPSLWTGPVLDVEMVWFVPEHAASARSGAARAPRTTSEAPASSQAREIRAPPRNVEMLERPSIWRRRARRPLFFMPMTLLLPKSKRFFLTYRFYSQKTCLLAETLGSSPTAEEQHGNVSKPACRHATKDGHSAISTAHSQNDTRKLAD
jgi:hypothetical protein